MFAILLASLLSLINASRADAHLRPLAYDAALNDRAQARAEMMCRSGRFSHDGVELAFRGLPYRTWGENLAKGYRSPEATHAGLMSSPDHRANILKPAFGLIGIGHACDITVELFGG
ncbi:MAG TPA: CAP domain-containing protein [Reyranella sp.]|jgi:uncharacterized protein YkwD|nr:CAP domain-containing protein [Reyranella sp.]